MLPEIEDLPAYRRVIADEAAWRPALRVIAERHGLSLASLQRAPSGTHVVYLGDGVVVKLIVPLWGDDGRAERRMLAHIGDRLPLATPTLLGEGELEGWQYLLLSRIPGRPLAELWPTLEHDEQRRLLAALGELAASLHALPLPDDEATHRANWREFLTARRERLVDKHRADGLSDAWIADIERTVAESPLAELEAAELAALHMDLHHDHLMVSEVGGRLELSGLFDFGDAMFGAREHELIAPLAFMAANVPGGAQALLRGYGYTQLDAALASRLTAQLLLQRYCKLSGVIARLRDAEPPRDLASLLARLFDFRE